MKGVMGMSSRSLSSRVLLPVEEGGSGGWVAGLMACARLCRSSADRMKRGILEGNWKREEGAARLLERLAREEAKEEKRAGKKVQGSKVKGEVVEATRRVSDGKKSHFPRKAVVV